MKKILLFDTSYGTRNMGDFIINEAVMREMDYLFSDSFLLRYGTHNPLLHHFQLAIPNAVSKTAKEVDYKFLGGTNLFKSNLLRPNSDWSIDLFTSSLYSRSVSLGCGFGGVDTGKTNKYTQLVYQRALSHEFVHAARDEATKNFLERLGFKAYNTGCPTLWGFNDERNSLIPESKAENVIFTLTDYAQDKKNDQILIDILNKNYTKVYFWIQGSKDLEYLKKFRGIESIQLVNPSLDAYRQVLQAGGIDYIGTRLHAGIFAMQHHIRSVILAVDNRARDMDHDHHLNVIERDNVAEVEDLLNSSFKTKVYVDHDLIDSWKAQFKVS